MFAPPPPDVQQEIDALRREVAEVRRAWDDRWVDQARAEEIRAVIRDVLADSATRTQMAGGPLWHSPYGGGQVIGSADGNWSLQAGVTEQVRFVYANAYGHGPSSTDDQTRWGWEMRRMNLIMAGTVLDPSVS